MTGLYTMTLCLGAAAGAGAAVPVEQALEGWPVALAVWAVPALIAALAWFPYARRGGPARPPQPGKLLRSALAWRVTAFMGLQSSLAYILFGWLPLLLQGRGLDPLHAGLYASLVTLCQAPGALITATLAARARDQRAWIVGIPGITALAFLVVAFGADALRIPAAGILGFGVGGCFGLALTLIVLRAADAGTAAGLSAMAQGIGYVFAALGPSPSGSPTRRPGDGASRESSSPASASWPSSRGFRRARRARFPRRVDPSFAVLVCAICRFGVYFRDRNRSGAFTAHDTRDHGGWNDSQHLRTCCRLGDGCRPRHDAGGRAGPGSR